MIPLHMFVDKHAPALTEKYAYDIEIALQDHGMSNFRDWSELYEDARKLVCEAFGVAEDACWDEEDIFDQAANYQYGLTDEVETRAMRKALPGVVGTIPTRRAEAVLYECAELMAKKGAANNRLPQADYYAPLESLYGEHDRGESAIFTMMWQKMIRIRSLLAERNGSNEFEGVEDSARDLINYTSFLIEFMEGKMNGQLPKQDEDE